MRGGEVDADADEAAVADVADVEVLEGGHALNYLISTS